MAKDAVHAAKAAAKAASGNFAGALKDAAQTTVGKYLIYGCLSLALIIVLALSSVPALVFGMVEEFEAERGEVLASEAEAAGNSLADVVTDIPSYIDSYSEDTRKVYTQTLGSTIKSFFGFSSGLEDYDTIKNEPYSYYVVGRDSSDETVDYAKQVLADYVDATLRRCEKRREQYRDLLTEIADDLRTHPEYYDAWDSTVYDDIQVNEYFNVQELTRADVISWLCAYSIQRGGNSLYDLSATSYMSWLGYYWSGNREDTGYVCRHVSGRTYATVQWQGDCLPQYLYEELLTRGDELQALNPALSDNDLQLLKKDIAQDYESYAFSFLAEAYKVNKRTGIITTSHAETVSIPSAEENGEAETAEDTQTVLVVDLRMNSELLPAKRASGKNDIVSLLGLWENDLEQEQNNTDLEKQDYFARTWVSPVNGQIYSRRYGYQVEYLTGTDIDCASDMITFVKKYLAEDYNLSITANRVSLDVNSIGASYVDLSSLDFSIAGATEAQCEQVQNLIALAYDQIGNDNIYWRDHGNSSMEWCGMFVMWCLKNTGYSALEDNFRMGEANSRCAHGPWYILGGGLSYNSDLGEYVVIGDGSSEYGSTILYDNTVLSDTGTYIPQVGDLVFFTHSGTVISHIGIVVSYNTETKDLITVEGNTSAPGYSHNVVWLKNRTNKNPYSSTDYGIVGFAHPKY